MPVYCCQRSNSCTPPRRHRNLRTVSPVTVAVSICSGVRELGPALLRLEALYDMVGERDKAQEARTRLLSLWRRADAALQPVVAEVRARITSPEQ
jgi:hypothetical protein